MSALLSTGPRLLTVADFAAFPDSLPSGDVFLELDDGRLAVLPLPTLAHSTAAGNVGFQLKLQGERAGFGKARGRVAVILRRNPDRVVVPDACFVANASLPVRVSVEDFHEAAPDLVVEVRDRTDTPAELARKAGEYLAAGSKLVWVIDPIDGNAVVYEAGHPPRTLAATDDLTAGAVVPGFRLSVADALRV